MKITYKINNTIDRRDITEKWCCENCKNGCVYKSQLGMVKKDGTQCARNTCKPFCDHKF